MREIRVGFLQQHNTADTKDNILRLGEGITDLAKRGAQLIVLQELHNTLYFCQTEDVDLFDLAETICCHSSITLREACRWIVSQYSRCHREQWRDCG